MVRVIITKAFLIVCLLCHFLLPADVSASSTNTDKLAITQVSVSPQLLIAENRTSHVRFHINKPSLVILNIYNAIDALVWRSEAIALLAGEHSIPWSGVDLQGKSVAPEVYNYVIEAIEQKDSQKKSSKKNKSIASVIYDVTDITGGEPLRLEAMRYDPKTKKLHFTAPKTGRYIVRAGIARSFAIDTLINNKVVVEGAHSITWDGYDSSRVFNAAEHPNLIWGSEGYALNDNAIVVLPHPQQMEGYYRTHAWQEGSSETIYRENKKIQREKISPHYYRLPNRSYDVSLHVKLPESIQHKDNTYLIQADKNGSTKIPINIDLASNDIMVMEAQRGEIVLFLDSQLIHDNEVSYYPYTFNWTPPLYDNKEHLLTVFVAGFAGNIGMHTLKVKLNSYNGR